MTLPAFPQNSLDFLDRVLRAFDPSAESAAHVLFEAARRNDLPMIDATREHLANLLGLAFVAAQAVLNGKRDERPLDKGPKTRHQWLTDVEFIDSIANFWKHHGQWENAEWDMIEGAAWSRADVQKAKGHRTAMQLAGLGVSRTGGGKNMFVLTNALGPDGTWSWLQNPMRAWWK
jgi:hypothetical protein